MHVCNTFAHITSPPDISGSGHVSPLQSKSECTRACADDDDDDAPLGDGFAVGAMSARSSIILYNIMYG